MLKILSLLLATFALSACSLVTGIKEPPMQYAEHPLAGRIWDVERERFIEPAQLMAASGRSRYLLLGETHDNPLHHRHQAWMIGSLARAGRRAAVLFEMIDDSQARLLADQTPQDADQLIEVLDRISNGWRYDPRYKPLFAQALAAGYTILPASLGRESIRDIIRRGEQAIPPATRRLLTDHPLDAAQQASLRGEIEQSHCGMLPAGMADGMMRAQRSKDATMAARMTQQGEVDVRVLVAGSGHGRRDRGVPRYLPDASGKDIVSIGWMEVVPDETSPAAYAAHWDGQRLPFDYVWFTPRVEREDPCAAMRAHFRKDN